VDDKALRKRLIRLAYEKPELRPEILPLVTKKAARADLMEWQALIPGSEVRGSKEWKALQAFWDWSRGELIEAVDLDGALEMAAWDLGYQGRDLRFAPGLEFLGKVRRLNLRKEHQDGQRSKTASGPRVSATTTSAKYFGTLNVAVDLKVNVLSGGWSDDEDMGRGPDMYHADVVFSAKVQVREGMASWYTLYDGKNVKGTMFSDPGGGFYLEPKSGRFHSDKAINGLVDDILQEAVWRKLDKPNA